MEEGIHEEAVYNIEHIISEDLEGIYTLLRFPKICFHSELFPKKALHELLETSKEDGLFTQ